MNANNSCLSQVMRSHSCCVPSSVDRAADILVDVLTLPLLHVADQSCTCVTCMQFVCSLTADSL